jgi:8-oxo-dGTP pyrophosphatase MutT (NUDIX family)
MPLFQPDTLRLASFFFVLWEQSPHNTKKKLASRTAANSRTILPDIEYHIIETELYDIFHTIVRIGEKDFMTTQPRLASTVMLIRNLPTGMPGMEVFMVRRVVQSEFMPDVYVFPGGSVSTGDRSAEETPGLCAQVSSSLFSNSDPEGRTALGTGTRAAAIRELFEEANVLLAYHDGQLLAIDQQRAAHFATYRQALNQRRGSLLEMARREGLVLATDQLVYCAHWITPESLPKRYDTHFFLAKAPAQQEAIYDHLETSDGVWIEPEIALERFAAGTFPIAFPTYHQLHALTAFSSTEKALQTAAVNPIATQQPRLKDVDGVPHVYLPDKPERLWKIS